MAPLPAPSPAAIMARVMAFPDPHRHPTLRRAVDRAVATPFARCITTIAIGWILTSIYTALNWALVPRFEFVLALDAAVPFLPWTILVYWSYYFLFVAAAWRLTPQPFLRVVGDLVLASVLSWACFLTLPAHVPRPDPSLLAEPWRTFYSHLHAIDPPGNSVPSLHVALSLLVGYSLRRQPAGWLWPVWGAVIALSTLTTRQHVLIDLAAGIALAFGVRLLRRAPPVAATPSDG